MYPLVIMPCRSNEHESVRTVTNVKRLVRRIDFIPEGIHGPGESHQGYHAMAIATRRVLGFLTKKKSDITKHSPNQTTGGVQRS